jgi:hypothetical protein
MKNRTIDMSRPTLVSDAPGLPGAHGMQAEAAEERQDHEKADEIAEQRDLERMQGRRRDADRAELHRDAAAAEQHQQCRPDQRREAAPPARHPHGDAAPPAAGARADIGV